METIFIVAYAIMSLFGMAPESVAETFPLAETTPVWEDDSFRDTVGGPVHCVPGGHCSNSDAETYRCPVDPNRTITMGAAWADPATTVGTVFILRAHCFVNPGAEMSKAEICAAARFWGDSKAEPFVSACAESFLDRYTRISAPHAETMVSERAVTIGVNPPCATEDQEVGPCDWNASVQGNGIGDSFTVTEGGDVIYW